MGVPVNNTIFAFVALNKYSYNLYDIESRNLGYISDLQTSITNLFKANIIDYICDTTTEKIGKFSPGSHIPIVPISHFHNNFLEIIQPDANHLKSTQHPTILKVPQDFQ